MAASISISDDDITTALRGFLLSLISTEVVLAQENRVPMPVSDFCTMTPLGVNGLSTNRYSYTDPGTVTGGSQQTTRTNVWRCQLDFYGETAQSNSLIVATMVRSEYAVEQFKSMGYDIRPLYSGEPHQTTMINGEQQYESRWTLDFSAQVNAVITTPMQFMDIIDIGLVEVDTKFPPENA
ncbi:Uncharacterised protein [Serratia grimesii]|uniref:phage neck terminator protein n=1 Tax=Serratia grimesii TaxID=82995 RepID=UPI00217949E8|nr:hypothetical protein [Serratia grimesii]CAI1839791.1 Uncharacterised protein [Serratia grimesii]